MIDNRKYYYSHWFEGRTVNIFKNLFDTLTLSTLEGEAIVISVDAVLDHVLLPNDVLLICKVVFKDRGPIEEQEAEERMILAGRHINDVHSYD